MYSLISFVNCGFTTSTSNVGVSHANARSLHLHPSHQDSASQAHFHLPRVSLSEQATQPYHWYLPPLCSHETPFPVPSVRMHLGHDGSQSSHRFRAMAGHWHPRSFEGYQGILRECSIRAIQPTTNILLASGYIIARDRQAGGQQAPGSLCMHCWLPRPASMLGIQGVLEGYPRARGIRV